MLDKVNVPMGDRQSNIVKLINLYHYYIIPRQTLLVQSLSVKVAQWKDYDSKRELEKVFTELSYSNAMVRQYFTELCRTWEGDVALRQSIVPFYYTDFGYVLINRESALPVSVCTARQWIKNGYKVKQGQHKYGILVLRSDDKEFRTIHKLYDVTQVRKIKGNKASVRRASYDSGSFLALEKAYSEYCPTDGFSRAGKVEPR